MKTRPSARILLIDEAGCVLLFRFDHRNGPLAGRSYWATPGGTLEPGETWLQAAIRELYEETGIQVAALEGPVDERQFEMQLPSGEWVISHERLFVLRTSRQAISRERWSALERDVMAEHRWWSASEMAANPSAARFPRYLPALLARLTANRGR